jgi:putative DNA primase/helicase
LAKTVKVKMIESQFKSAMTSAGLNTKCPIIADGQIHRFQIDGDKPQSKNGWYVLYHGDISAGSYGSWKDGTKYTWCSKSQDTMTSAEKTAYRQTIAKAKQQREQAEERRRNDARAKAKSIWLQSYPAPNDHPYLLNKGVQSHGLRTHNDMLVIPLRDNQGTLQSLQFIDAHGNKRFLSGGQKKGCYFAIGSPQDSICIAEGYATASSLYNATGKAVAVAFDAGNLLPVAKALRFKFPNAKITICADNDTQSPCNIGVTKAKEAAIAIDGLIAIPPCHGDFNDFYNGTNS